jgi:DNA-binding MarR family transcriptional regulator
MAREVSPDSRREVLLQLSPAGAALVEETTARRRADIEALVGLLSARQRRDLASALAPLIAATVEAGEHAWVLGWAD